MVPLILRKTPFGVQSSKFRAKSLAFRSTMRSLEVKTAQHSTWTPKVCKIMAFMAILMGLGLLFYILLGFR